MRFLELLAQALRFLRLMLELRSLKLELHGLILQSLRLILSFSASLSQQRAQMNYDETNEQINADRNEIARFYWKEKVALLEEDQVCANNTEHRRKESRATSTIPCGECDRRGEQNEDAALEIRPKQNPDNGSNSACSECDEISARVFAEASPATMECGGQLWGEFLPEPD